MIFTTFRKSQDLPDMSFIAYLDQVKKTFLDMKPVVRRSNLSRMSLKNFFQRLFSLSIIQSNLFGYWKVQKRRLKY